MLKVYSSCFFIQYDVKLLQSQGTLTNGSCVESAKETRKKNIITTEKIV